MESIASVGILSTLYLLIFHGTAHAYLDPGSGSIVFQLLAAGLLGALYFLKSFWRKVANFLIGMFRGKNDR